MIHFEGLMQSLPVIQQLQPLEMKHAWRHLIIDADLAERCLTRIYNVVQTMKPLLTSNEISQDEWEEVREWYRNHWEAFRRYAIEEFRGECFLDGSGI